LGGGWRDYSERGVEKTTNPTDFIDSYENFVLLHHPAVEKSLRTAVGIS